MLGELCTDISKRLGTFIEEIGDLEQDKGGNKKSEGRTRKRQRAEPAGDIDQDDEDYNADEDDDEDSDDDDADEDPEDDGSQDSGGARGNPRVNAEGNDGADFDDQASNLEKRPRRSARLVNIRNNEMPLPDSRQSSMDNNGWQAGIDRREGCPKLTRTNEDNQCAANTQSPQRTTHLPDLSPFFEIREFVATKLSEEIDMRNSEPPQSFDMPGKVHPKNNFMEEIIRLRQVSPATTPPLDQFRSDPVVENLQAECIALDKLAIRGDKPVHANRKQKTCVQRGRPVDDDMPKTTLFESTTTRSMAKTTYLGVAATSGLQPQCPTARDTASMVTVVTTKKEMDATRTQGTATFPTSGATLLHPDANKMGNHAQIRTPATSVPQATSHGPTIRRPSFLNKTSPPNQALHGEQLVVASHYQ